MSQVKHGARSYAARTRIAREVLTMDRAEEKAGPETSVNKL